MRSLVDWRLNLRLYALILIFGTNRTTRLGLLKLQTTALWNIYSTSARRIMAESG